MAFSLLVQLSARLSFLSEVGDRVPSTPLHIASHFELGPAQEVMSQQSLTSNSFAACSSATESTDRLVTRAMCCDLRHAACKFALNEAEFALARQMHLS
jgi:hypothetical protein